MSISQWQNSKEWEFLEGRCKVCGESHAKGEITDHHRKMQDAIDCAAEQQRKAIDAQILDELFDNATLMNGGLTGQGESSKV